LIVLLAGVLLLAAQLAAPLLNVRAPVTERLSLPYPANDTGHSMTDSKPGVARQRVASAELTDVLGGAAPAAPGRPTPSPRAIRLEWATNPPALYAEAASLRLVELLAN